MFEAEHSLLTVDCGNSTIDCLVHGAAFERLQLSSRGADTEALIALVRARVVGRCLAASVVPDVFDAIERQLRTNGVRVLRVGRDVACPMRLAYDTPATLGADRWLGTLAAHRLFGRAVVVDCGSATTINVVEEDGTFCGGSIAPGLGAFAAGMAATTPLLPPPDPDGTPEVPARTSRAAIDTGHLLGYSGLVERLVAEHLRTMRGPAHVVITGGNAARLRRHTRLRARYEPALVHQGLAFLSRAAPWNS